MTFKFSKSSLFNLATVDERLQTLAKEVLKISPVDFAITSGFRTLEKQQLLFKQKKSKCDGIKNKSKHQEGKAIDICPVIDGKLNYSPEGEYDLFFILGLFYLKARELSDKYKTSGGSEGLNIKLRLGAFWDYSSIKTNFQEGFMDGYHMEIKN
jgi:hypothetical protein